MKKDTWVIVSNSSLARIFKVEKGQSLTEVETFIHPASRLRDADLVTDKPGRGEQSAYPSHFGIEPKTTPKEHEIESFAKELAVHLETARTQGLFDRLYLAANPSFLGLLRNEFTSSIQELIIKEVNKDITSLRLDEMGKYFFV